MDKWLIWCDLNVEQDLLKKTFGDLCVSIQGSTPNDEKIRLEQLWREGDIPILISKPSVFGFGMNWQHCNKIIFFGVSHSFEQYYQAVRRCWRFGQTEPVDVYIITSEKEGAVVKNIKRKEKEFNKMLKGMIAATSEITKENIQQLTHKTDTYETEDVISDNWEMHMGDAIQTIKNIEDNSIHLCCYSPPFSSLYTYSNSEKDIGNCRTDKEFYNHFSFLVDELYRVMIPGRLMSVHAMNIPSMKERDGVIGLKDFRGDLIKMFINAGFIYHSEVCIFKDPVVQMQRTKSLGLLHKQIKKDSCMSRQGLPDYVITMRKPGDNPERVEHTNESFPVNVWQRYASPIWMDINPSDTLQKKEAREHEDERHIAPLQLEVIRRVLELWTNPGDTVLDPFAGIGSTGYEAVKFERKFIGLELKKSYFEQAVKNLVNADKELLKPKQIGLEVFE